MRVEERSAYVATLASGVLPHDEGGPASQALLLGPGPLAFDPKGNLYFGEEGTDKLSLATNLGNLPSFSLPHLGARIRRIALDGTIHTVAGEGSQVLNDPDNDDILLEPLGLVIDRAGHLVVSDIGTNQIKLVPLPAS